MTSVHSQSTNMPPSLTPLTLIVATTPSLGIGFRGNLPWPALKSDMAFFARVTKHIPAPFKPSSTDGSRNIKNAVIMGRKTWESIPAKFRPLKDRINVIITRSPDDLKPALQNRKGDAFAVTSIEEALKELTIRFPSSKAEHLNDTDATTALGRSFVIGGAEIYKLALETASCERILWTRLKNEFDCDTFFPESVLTLDQELTQSEGSKTVKWSKASNEELSNWTGEADAGESKQDGEVEYQVVMLEERGSIGLN